MDKKGGLYLPSAREQLMSIVCCTHKPCEPSTPSLCRDITKYIIAPSCCARFACASCQDEDDVDRDTDRSRPDIQQLVV